MNEETAADRFLELSIKELKAVNDVIPEDAFAKTAALLDVVRGLDYFTICEPYFPDSNKLGVQDLQLIHWGWNTAAELLLTPVSQPRAMPLPRGSRHGATFLHQSGRACLLKRTSEMIRQRQLSVRETADGFAVHQTPGADRQFIDQLEHNRLDELEKQFGDGRAHSNGWTVVDYDQMKGVKNEPGAYWSRANLDPLAGWKQEDVDALMLPLIEPWQCADDVMISYGAHPDVDNHFMVEGLEFIDRCRRESGIHPECRFGGTDGSDVTAIAAIVAGLHLKHIRFALLAQKANRDISLYHSLTIWGPRLELIESIAEFSGLDLTRVDAALSAIDLPP